MATQIVFSKGISIAVSEDLDAVAQRADATPLAVKLTIARRGAVLVNWSNVAYCHEVDVTESGFVREVE